MIQNKRDTPRPQVGGGAHNPKDLVGVENQIPKKSWVSETCADAISESFTRSHEVLCLCISCCPGFLNC